MEIVISGNNPPRLVGGDGFYFDEESLRVRSNFGATDRSECDCSDEEYADTWEHVRSLSAQATRMTERFREAVKAEFNLGKYDEIKPAHMKKLMYRSIGNPWTVEV